jgi:hypothetical protein
MLAQRFIQQSLAVSDAGGAARLVPVDFVHAPPAAKPRHNADAAQWEAYRQLQREQSLGRVAQERLRALRATLDQREATRQRQLICSVDGGYTNRTFLCGLPRRTCVIGRIRGDAKLYHLPAAQPSRGRRRCYGEPAPTPEQLRQDESVPWQEVEVYFGGARRSVRVKTLAALRWRATGREHDLRLVVIAPTGYRLSRHGRQLYRKPAYLVCTDPQLSVERIVQSYLWRWEIEVNFRDEKTLLGVGQAQVHHALSVGSVPALSVAAYAILLTTALRLYGLDGPAVRLPPPKWQTDKPARASSQQLISQLRHDLWGQSINYSDFAIPAARNAKSLNSQFPLSDALFYGAAQA